MKNIAVLGARGFIGSSTAEYLRKNDCYHVIPVTRDEVDLLNGIDVKNFLAREEVDIVIHCANEGGNRKNQSRSLDIVENNLRMFFNIERALVTEMIFINFGSGAQYDKTRDLYKVSEDRFDEYIPSDAYGYSKYIMSKYIRQRDEASKGIIYNPIIFGMYGIGEDYTYRFISNTIVKNILGMPIKINQDVIFDYLYLEDYYKVLDKMLGDEILEGEREFNMTPTESISLSQLAEIVNQVGVMKSQVIIKNPGMNYQYTGDNTRLLQKMDRDFKFTPYVDAIQKMYQYYYDNIDKLELQKVRDDILIKYCKVKG